MTNFDELSIIIERIASGNSTEADIAALRQLLNAGDRPLALQLGKYNVSIDQGKGIQIGDRIYHRVDAEAIREIVRSLLQELKSPIFAASTSVKSVDELVEQVRSRFHNDIQRLHGTMPLLGVDHWVDLGELFVDVNILEEVSSSRKSELNDLWQDFSAGVGEYSYLSLDRIGLGKQQERMPGLTVLGKNTDLMVLGKPGSGKTTFLQRIITECNKTKLQPHRIPVLIKMREFVDDGRIFEYSLERYLTQQWRLSEVETELVLSQGRGLILLDGLDEVTGENRRKISKKIKQFVRTYPQNQLVITCRTQSQESRFERFDYVEVADFNEAQVNAFAEHWFKVVCSNAEEGQAKARQFLDKLSLEENKTIRELAITPILLSLTCAVFQAQGKFYSKRSKLYEEGLELLLEKWDKSRSIERDEIYRDLCMDRKQELLSYLAVKKFEQAQYVLFEQEEIEGYIAEFLQISRRDSRVVLHAIEAQHGLLIERSQKVWSFSHLTFQEYFVAKWYCVRTDGDELVNYITKTHWREVFLLISGILPNADCLLESIKSRIDKLLMGDNKLQQFLERVDEKAKSVDVEYKPVAVRAFYFALARSLNHKFALDLSQNQALTNFYQDDLAHALDYRLDAEDFRLIDTYDFSFELSIDYDLAHGYNLSSKISHTLSRELRESLQNLHKNFPYYLEDEDLFKNWWQVHGQLWTEQLRSIMIKHRNIGHNWQLCDTQIELLQQYYDTNKLLIDCLNSACAVSIDVRQEIEETLLLPIAEIEKRNRER